MNLIRCYAKISDALATAACVLRADGSGALWDLPCVREVKAHISKDSKLEESKTIS
jgi:hypothetical protein